MYIRLCVHVVVREIVHYNFRLSLCYLLLSNNFCVCVCVWYALMHVCELKLGAFKFPV